jgi:hypothetical protein
MADRHGDIAVRENGFVEINDGGAVASIAFVDANGFEGRHGNLELGEGVTGIDLESGRRSTLSMSGDLEHVPKKLTDFFDRNML